MKRIAVRIIAMVVACCCCWPMSAAASGPVSDVEVTGGTRWNDYVPNFRTGGIVYNGEYLLMYPYGGHRLYKSVDGVNWETVNLRVLQEDGLTSIGISRIERIIWDGKQFVAIADTKLLTSEDGQFWTMRSIPHPDANKEYELADIVFTGDAYVIVAQDRDKNISGYYVRGPNTFFVSKDLKTFEIGIKENMTQSAVGERPVDYLATNGKVIIGGGNGTVVSSDGGKHWTAPETSPFGPPYAAFNAIWDGRQFVHARWDTISTSKDGKTWNSHTMKVAGDNKKIEVEMIAFNGAEYIAVGNYSIGKGPLVIYRSYDLHQWEKIEIASTETNISQIEPFRDGFVLLGTHTWLYRNHRLSVPSDWAEAAVAAAREHQLASDDILNNYRKPITRAEFAEVSVRLYDRITGGSEQELEQDAGVESPFQDTNNPYVARAYKLGIVSGKGEGKFAPFESISRQDMAVMLDNLLKAAGVPLQRADRQWQRPYADVDQISGYAVESLKLLNSEGIIQGSGDSIQPRQTATREQALVIAERIYQLCKSLSE